MKAIDPRKQQILEHITAKGFATPEDLARVHGVAPITVRRGLVWLEQAGLLRRVHGGAIPCEAPLAVTHVAGRMRIAEAEKRAIARTALRHIAHGERLFLDAGSTCCCLAEALPDNMNLTVITHSLDNLRVLALKKAIRTVGLCGELDAFLNALVGPMTEAALKAFHVDTAFLSATGVDLETGFTDNSLSEGHIKALMADHARKTIVLADGSKFGHTGFRAVLALNRASLVITDAHVPERLCAALRRQGLEIVKAPLAD